MSSRAVRNLSWPTCVTVQPQWDSDQVLCVVGVVLSAPFHHMPTYKVGYKPQSLEWWEGGGRGIARWREDSPGFLIHFRQICEMVRKSTVSYLEPYLRTLPGLESPSLLWVPTGAMAPSYPGAITIISQGRWENLPPLSTSPSTRVGYGMTTSLGGLFSGGGGK